MQYPVSFFLCYILSIKTSDNSAKMGPYLMTFLDPGSSSIIDRQTETKTEELRDRWLLFKYCSQVLYSMDFSNCGQHQNRKSMRSLFQIYGVSSLSVNFHEFLEH